MVPSTIHWVRQKCVLHFCTRLHVLDSDSYGTFSGSCVHGKENDTGKDFLFREKHEPQIWPLRKYRPSKAREIAYGINVKNQVLSPGPKLCARCDWGEKSRRIPKAWWSDNLAESESARFNERTLSPKVSTEQSD